MRERALNWLADLAMTRRRTVYLTALVLTVALGAATSLLTLDVRWTTLVPPSLPVVQEYHKIDHHFLQPANMIIAIQGPDPAMLERLTDEVADALRREMLADPSWSADRCKAEGRFAKYVYGKLPEEWMTAHALSLVKPKDARRIRDLLRDPRLVPYLRHLNDDLEREYTDEENVRNQERDVVASLDAVEGLVRALDEASKGSLDPDRLRRVVRDLTVGCPYMMSLDHGMSLVMVAPAIPSEDIEAMPMIDRRAEEILRPFEEKYPEYRFERTGEIAVGRDEMDSVGPETRMITGIALLLIFLLLVWNFRSGFIPLLALLPIVVGVIWTVGTVALVLRSMNLFTVMIGVVLLGLGIDFSLHLTNRFQEETAAGRSIRDSLRLMLEGTGAGVLTGGITTAVAFLALMIADTRGIREFGFCAGAGVLLTLLAVFWLLPSLLVSWTLRHRRKPLSPMRSRDFSPLGRMAVAMGRARWIVIPVVTAAALAGAWAGTILDWEWNFMNLEPAGLRSVELQDEIIDRFKLSVNLSLLTVDSIEESRTLREKLKTRSLVGDVDDVSLWVSRPDVAENRTYVAELRDALNEAPPSMPSSPQPDHRAERAEELDRLWANLVELQALSFIGGLDRVVEKTTRLVASREERDRGLLRQVVDRFEKDPPDGESVDRFAREFALALRTQALRMTADDSPVTLDQVPEDVRARYASETAPGYLVQILPKRNLFVRDELERFQNQVTSLHPRVTGFPQMMLEMNLVTLKEGKIAFWAALVAIVVVLLIDFRRPLIAGIAILPLVAGLALTLGTMWLMREKIHYINLIALPVILGIGVDDGVHFLHRSLQEGRGRTAAAATGVGRAMVMTSLTTMVGFGSLTLYLMRGLASLGRVLTIGVGLCLLVTLILLPALTRVFEGCIFRHSRSEDQPREGRTARGRGQTTSGTGV